MCELLGLSASTPVNARLSFARLAAHGGPGGQPDGWGVALMHGEDAQIWRDPQAAASSHWAEHIAHEAAPTALLIAHIRSATQGHIALANTHPFTRELFGRTHVFAHNGNFAGMPPLAEDARFRPIGQTDSEAAFCHVLGEVAAAGDEPDTVRAVFAAAAARLRALGHGNLLYASGDRLLAHADQREANDGSIGPGLWVLERHRHPPAPPAAPEAPEAPLHIAEAPERITLLASVPLTHEHWRPLPRGTVLEITGGEVTWEGATE